MPISFLAQGIPSGSHSFGTMWLSQPTLTQITPQDDHTQHNSEEKPGKLEVAHLWAGDCQCHFMARRIILDAEKCLI